MSEERYTIDYTGTGCKSSDEIAYTYIGMMTVYLCALFWKLPMWGLDSKIGALIHKDTHIMAGLYDITYGTTACRSLAKNDPFEAVHNADSYKYYVMS